MVWGVLGWFGMFLVVLGVSMDRVLTCGRFDLVTFSTCILGLISRYTKFG